MQMQGSHSGLTWATRQGQLSEGGGGQRGTRTRHMPAALRTENMSVLTEVPSSPSASRRTAPPVALPCTKQDPASPPPPIGRRSDL